MHDVKLTGEARAALRSAIRAALAQRGETGAHVSGLGKAELLALANTLGVDVAAVLGMTFPVRQPAASPVLSNDTHNTTEPNDVDTMTDTLTAGPALETLADAPVVDETVREARQEAPPAPAAAVDDAVRAVMAPLGQGDVGAFRDALSALARDALRGPATVVREVTRTVVREVNGPALAPLAPGALPYATRAGAIRCGDVFGPAAAWEADTRVAVWDAHGAAPERDPHFRWSPAVLPVILSAWAERRHVFLWGPAGTGKTTMVQQLAAQLGRPYVRVSCTATTEATELVGMTVPAAGGGTKWQDGQLAAAIRRPGTVILIDEPSVARAGALFVLQAVLDSRELHVAETGEVIRVAEGVVFAIADNTNGTGDATGQYEDTGRLNKATRDRFVATVRVDYLSAAEEAAVIESRERVPAALARLLVDFAAVTRREVDSGRLTEGLGLRRLLALAMLLRRGAPLAVAWDVGVMQSTPAADREVLSQLRLTCLSDAAVADAMGAQAAPAALTTPAGASTRARRAAQDFTPVNG